MSNSGSAFTVSLLSLGTKDFVTLSSYSPLDAIAGCWQAKKLVNEVDDESCKLGVSSNIGNVSLTPTSWKPNAKGKEQGFSVPLDSKVLYRCHDRNTLVFSGEDTSQSYDIIHYTQCFFY